MNRHGDEFMLVAAAWWFPVGHRRKWYGIGMV